MNAVDRDIDRLEQIMDLIDAIDRRLGDFDRARFVADRDESDLTAFRLSHIGQAAGKLSSQIRDRYPDIARNRMVGLRNVVSHEYGVIDASIVWKTATEDLSRLQDICVAELASLNP